jgi:DNA-binding CsgD family transcriptional regulator/Flp pilus assembly protein TadD
VHRSLLVHLLFALTRKSLVHQETVGGCVRHRLLDTLREYALEQLRESGEEASYCDRHLDRFLELAEADYSARNRARPSRREPLSAERDNLLAALTWARDRNPEKGLALAGTLVQEQTSLIGAREGHKVLSDLLESGISPSRSRLRALNATGALALHHNDLDEAGTLIGQAIALAEELNCLDERAWGDLSLAIIDLIRDEPSQARRHIDQALGQFSRSGNRFGWVRAEVRRIAFDVMFSRGAKPESEQLVADGVEVARAIDDAGGEASALGAYGYWTMLRGDRTKAAMLFKRALALDVDDEATLYLLRLYGLGAAISRSEPWKAMRLWGGATAHGERAGWTRLPPVYERVLTKPQKEAVRLIGEEEAERARAEGARLTKEQLLREAAEVDALRDLGRTIPGSLTEREFEIVRLVAGGSTSPEIADQLHLSRRTVENHVQHALSKLGFNNRTQLAGWFSRLRAPAVQ